MGLYNRENNNRHKNAKKVSFFLTTTAENEAVHSQYLMMIGIMILLLVLRTTIPLSMQKKSRKIHGYLPQQQPNIETLKKYIFSNDHHPTISYHLIFYFLI